MYEKPLITVSMKEGKIKTTKKVARYPMKEGY